MTRTRRLAAAVALASGLSILGTATATPASASDLLTTDPCPAGYRGVVVGVLGRQVLYACVR